MKKFWNLLLFVGIISVTTFVACGEGEVTTDESALGADTTSVVIEEAPAMEEMEVDTTAVDTIEQ